MRRRKRRRIMRTPSEADTASTLPVQSWPFSVSGKLCINGVCAVRRSAHASVAPSAFAQTEKGKYFEFTPDCLTVTRTKSDEYEKPQCSVRANNPVPSSGLALYYFEVTVISEGKLGNIAVGFCGRLGKLEKMPGADGGSYGYHGCDGCIFRQGSSGSKYGPKYSAGDVVGCCWDLVEDNVFFTLNGRPLGRAFESLKGPLYPVVGIQTESGSVEVNFGTRPFVFDIERYAMNQRDRVLSAAKARSLTTDYRLLSNTVLGYLLHSGYAETAALFAKDAALFAKDAGQEELLFRERSAMMERQTICKKIIGGDIDSAIQELNERFPNVLKEQLTIKFLLRTQKFIEMIMNNVNTVETVEYGQKELAIFRNPSKLLLPDSDDADFSIDGVPFIKILEEVWSLLAYIDPASSPSGYLTRQSRRDMVALKLNAAILMSQGRPTQSTLERLVCQSKAVVDRCLRAANGPCALVAVQDFL